MTPIKDHQKMGITVSICLFCFHKKEKHVLLIKNQEEPFKNAMMLPSKVMSANESIEKVTKSILKENIGNNKVYIEQLNAFAKQYRHPFERIIDISFYGLINIEKHNIRLNTNKLADLYSIENKPELAFDHDEIIDFALKRVKRRMKYRPIGINLLPDKFTMNELEELYASFMDKKFDKRNFRRRILEMDFVKLVTKVQRSHVGRKTHLYQFDEKKYKNYSKIGF
ncbi:MAG: NrtR DNA-binding winged helix domain-containing protein [Parvicellaceae bacterium]